MSNIKEQPNGLLDFLKTKRSKEELLICLEILQEFKRCESTTEWLMIPFEAWTKLEQFEDYLKLLTGKDADDVDDTRAKEFLKSILP